jgi:sulfur dioxygenase
MYFRILHDEAGGELTYLLADLQSREAVLIDPRGSDLTVLNAMLSERELRLRWVLRTHHHDPLHGHERTQLARLGAPLVEGRTAEKVHLARDGDVLDFGGEVVHVMATPGHTAGCLSFAWRDRIFCGGLLAVDACQNQPQPAEPELLWDSVRQRLFTLPDETLLFGSSDQRAWGVSTVLEQRRWHPFFAGLSRDEFLARVSRLSAQPERVSEATDHALIQQL